MQDFAQYLILIIIILGLVMVANRLRLAYPIVLVVGGLLLSFFTQFSQLTISPDLVFFIFLPPLLYEAAWQVSWKEFWKWRRIITGFAFPIVIFTSTIIAFISTALIPGFTLALGFLLGGIISPPDAVSATTIMRRLKLPKAMMSIAEGESLLNDATSLIVFRFALAAVITGHFSFSDAAVEFVLVVFMGVLIGLAIGLAFYLVHRWLPTTTSIDIVMTIVAPYCMYYAAEQFHFSGVLAVVSGGLFLSSKRQTMLSFRSRIAGVNVWTNLVFVLNGLVFILIGLQLPSIIAQLGGTSLPAAIWFGLAISLVLMLTRMVCTLGASVFSTFMSNFITVADAHPGWRNPAILGWSGMRGVVSLAMALSIPITIDGEPFPYRNLILFITFVVILATLVFQGMTLPWVIRKLNPEDHYTKIPMPEQELLIRKKMAHASLKFLEEKYSEVRESNEHVGNLFVQMTADVEALERELGGTGGDVPYGEFHGIYVEMLEHQRDMLNEMNSRDEYDEDLIRKYLALVDIEEFKMREKLQREDDLEA
ncbi:MAG TPA: Na+/H+ antiporter [Pyrinomonadaceae bacterium]|nr:Na+/H+ antiporter [Pyrinomonadaceae bacterium]